MLSAALAEHAAQEQFPPGMGAQKRLQAHSLGGRAVPPGMDASCKL